MATILDYANEGAAAYGGLGVGGFSNVGKEFVTQYALQEMANQREIENWKMQQDYNSPAAQMQRFADAGLNPNLVYSQGNSGNASSAPGVQMAHPNIAGAASADQQKQMNAFNMTLGAVSQMISATEEYLKMQGMATQNDLAKIELQKQQTLQRMFEPHSQQINDFFFHTIDPIQAYASYLDKGLGKQFLDMGKFMVQSNKTNFDAWKTQKYIEELFPKLVKAAESKNGILEIQKQMLDYNNRMLDTLPAEFRTIWLMLAPLIPK